MVCLLNIKKYNCFMKKIFAIITIIFALILILNYLFDDVDYCLDKGGCWNYQKKQCEMNNQGYCKSRPKSPSQI